MVDYYRPIPCEQGRFAMAGGWARFSDVEVLCRGQAPRIVPAASLGDTSSGAAALDALTRPRPDFAGQSMAAPVLMGIVNTTPDSFSDGGRYYAATEAQAHARLLLSQGAAILDVGGESTRPGAVTVASDEESARVIPVIAALSRDAVVSVDTRKAAVAQAACAAGAVMINDVSGLDFDPDMAGVMARTGAWVCLMHAQGVPQSMQDNPRYDDVLLDVYDALAARVARAEAAGIARDRIAIDPGIGFGKTEAHNLALLRRISLFHGLGLPVLLGVSRKRFIGRIGGVDRAGDRAAGTVGVTLAALSQGIQIHRVHDVADHAQAIALYQAVTQKEESF